jgi:hypothetical protein
MQNLDLKNYKSLIGKNLEASGWHYDNSGSVYGKITGLKQWSSTQIFVYTTKTYDWNMLSFTFTPQQLDELIEKGCLPKANKFLNTGTNAKLF